MRQLTNEMDVAAVIETARLYYEGSVAGDAEMLARAFHPRACIVGNEPEALYWATLDEYVAECQGAVDHAEPHEWRVAGLSFEGDTAVLRLDFLYAGILYGDSLTLLRIDDAWRIVHKTYYAHPGS